MRVLNRDAFVAARFPVPLLPDEIQLWFFATVERSDTDSRVRDLLGAYLSRTPPAIERDPFGKPHLAAPAALEFNLSHSHGALLIAISRSQALGVDIEDMRRRRPALELARRFFAADESAALARLDPALRAPAFFALWSCKEAVVKALGRGLAFGLARLAFELDPAGVPSALNVIDTSAGAAAEWQIVRLRPIPHFCGALAWRGPERPIRAFAARADANPQVAAVIQSG